MYILYTQKKEPPSCMEGGSFELVFSYLDTRETILIWVEADCDLEPQGKERKKLALLTLVFYTLCYHTKNTKIREKYKFFSCPSRGRSPRKGISLYG